MNLSNALLFLYTLGIKKQPNLMRLKTRRMTMIRFGKGVVKLRIPILVLSLALLVPSEFGIIHTRVNY